MSYDLDPGSHMSYMGGLLRDLQEQRNYASLMDGGLVDENLQRWIHHSSWSSV